MKRIVITLTEEQQALIKLSAIAIDAEASKPIIAAIDEKESVEIAGNDLPGSKEEQSQLIIAIGMFAVNKIAQELGM